MQKYGETPARVGRLDLAPEGRKTIATAEGRGAQKQRSAIFPSSPRRGGRDLNKISRSLLFGADGVVIKFHRILLRLNTTPSARAKDASRLFLDRAATPPRRGGENGPAPPFEQHPREAVVGLQRAKSPKAAEESFAAPRLTNR